MSKPDPIFSASDTPDNLPEPLKGKSPAEVAAYFQRREEIYKARLEESRRQPAPAPIQPAKKPEPATDDKFDMFGDPRGSVERVVDRKVAEAFDRASSMVTPGVINSARMECRQNHADYGRFAAEIEKRMQDLTPDARMQPYYWELTYKMVKGDMADALVAEARQSRDNPIERPTPKGSDAPEPRRLSPEERTVAEKFRMSDEDYLKAGERYISSQGSLPVTVDNRRRNKTTNKKT